MSDVVIITDTGKRTTSSGSVEETDLANSGSPITLKGVELSFESSAILNTNSTVGMLSDTADTGSMWTAGEVDTVGIMKPKWTASGLLDLNDSSDMASFAELVKLPKTKGYKTLGGDLPDWMDGSDNASTVSVHVENIKVRHRSDSNIIEYDIEMYQTD